MNQFLLLNLLLQKFDLDVMISFLDLRLVQRDLLEALDQINNLLLRLRHPGVIVKFQLDIGADLLD